MEQKPNQKAERVLGLVEPGRRNAMRKMLAAAYVAPAVASFSLDAMAVPSSCVAANQGVLDDTTFTGKMDCEGWRLDRTLDPNGTAEHVHFQLTNVTVRLRNGVNGGQGTISGGGTTLLPNASPASTTILFADFPDKKDEKVGFAVPQCEALNYFETGQWKRTTDKKGKQSLNGDSTVLVNSFSAFSGVTYTLDCHYDLDEASPV